MYAAIATMPATDHKPNEDFAAVTANGAVLLDGSDPNGAPSKCLHGVAWYSRHLGAAVTAGLLDESAALVDILASAIRETASLHSDTCSLDDPGTPAATVIATRTVGDRFQYLVLADSVLIIEPHNGPPIVITDDREAQVGKEHRATMDQHANSTEEHDTGRRVYVETLRAFRNQPGGFWVAAADPAAAAEALTGECSVADVKRVLMLSDGASRLADRFDLATWQELIDLAEDHGPAAIIARTRAAETEDPQGSRWPRGKVHDDATAILWGPGPKD